MNRRPGVRNHAGLETSATHGGGQHRGCVTEGMGQEQGQKHQEILCPLMDPESFRYEITSREIGVKT